VSPIGPALTSTHNPQVKQARLLGTRKARYRERAFLVEGTRLFEDAVSFGFMPERLFYDASRLSEPLVQTIKYVAAHATIVHDVPGTVIETLADTETPQGIIAIFRFPEVQIVLGNDAPLYVVADGIKDPGNLGTLMRSSAAAGAHALFVSRETVDPYSPKVIRAAMGAHFRLPLRQLNWDAPDPLLLSCGQRLAAEAGGDGSYDAVNWNIPSVLVLGSEATGISERALARVTGHVSIPLHGGVESLNAAVAGAVILFEAARQRRTQLLRPRLR
jgi:RNA methyltransferase, TrmH family